MAHTNKNARESRSRTPSRNIKPSDEMSRSRTPPRMINSSISSSVTKKTKTKSSKIKAKKSTAKRRSNLDDLRNSPNFDGSPKMIAMKKSKKAKISKAKSSAKTHQETKAIKILAKSSPRRKSKRIREQLLSPIVQSSLQSSPTLFNGKSELSNSKIISYLPEETTTQTNYRWGWLYCSII
ncbi:hypothetical protein SSS_02366 [Sarcoptes scabiei]|uniref:Uncharacterized protein n=1 Tax=Sarcoptes scabiei TaxID=52283 RepID=A0A132ALS8_SARSC|nr:hypothetical protein SSS_02366 [Sarcoptes scabiei]KPM11545.1 hypothetical protein QR98_0101180 [Sarcoptes scabiei]